jgi:hypothetical protein
VTTNGSAAAASPEHHTPVAELAARQGVRPIHSVDELALPDAWDSDDELADFLADLRASRHLDAR